ncbi:hypothetical protein CC86DRAFT_63793 [Ophiobolus disseminans]|uniref:Uncharacterized protein n=1 Tax=Ophiobolus disseminans TaxID=1469910 RepID=A0A6A6ZTI8_9PLEO|nr:hypothetical protein CC86DRAFT_63793 [Ophiobolus disseminans]
MAVDAPPRFFIHRVGLLSQSAPAQSKQSLHLFPFPSSNRQRLSTLIIGTHPSPFGRSETTMTPPKIVNVNHKMSEASAPGLSRAKTLVTPSSRPLTPISAVPSARRRGHRLTSLFDRYRVHEPEFEMLTPPSRAVAPPSPPPPISKHAKAFVDALTASRLSDFLTWMLYYDIVDLPDSPTAWYQTITNMDMRGWVALGDFLSKTSKSMDTGYGFDLVVLDAICDRISLQRSTVHSMLIHFADHEKMEYSLTATVYNQCRKNSLSPFETLEAVQMKLKELKELAKHLTPTKNSIYETWLAQVIKQIDRILESVIGSRIANLRSGAPLITAATSEQLPQKIKDGIQLTYAYEVMQLKRQVPLNRYEIYPAVIINQFETPPPLPPGGIGSTAATTRHQIIQYYTENQILRAQVAELQRDKEKLQDSNYKLARRFATLARTPLRNHALSPTNDIFASSQDNTQTLQIPRDPTHPHSLPPSPNPPLTTPLPTHPFPNSPNPQPSHALSSKYHDVFSALDTPPSPPIRLSDPATGGLLEPSTPDKWPSHAAGYAVGAGRRSGMIFTADQKNLVAGIRGATPESEEGSGGDGEVGEGDNKLGTPTPGPRDGR